MQKYIAHIAIVIALIAAGLTVYLLRGQRSEMNRMQSSIEILMRENDTLRQSVYQTRAVELATATSAAPDGHAGQTVSPGSAAAAASVESPAATGTSASPPSTADLVPTPTGKARPPRADGLKLAGAQVAPIGNGLSASLQFDATTTDPLGIVAVVVRLPRDSDSRILDWGPEDTTPYANIARRISEDGKFAVFEGTAQAVASLRLALSVSRPVTADVRGTCGIGPYSLAISPTGATVKPPAQAP